MARVIEQDGKRYLLDGYKFTEIPDTRNKAFFKGKMFNFSETVNSFLKGKEESCIVPVYCTQISEKRAFKSVILITKTEEYRFTNSERGQYSYYRNEIKDIQDGRAYFIFLEKFGRARNDCLIKAVKEINK